ncbi:MAG: TonB-dependent receptor [Methylotenera sp.]|nr:MAG: TonB-dependent receptor [Methylotenera sp.]
MKKQAKSHAIPPVTPITKTTIKTNYQQNHTLRLSTQQPSLHRPNLIKYWVGLSCLLLGANAYAQTVSAEQQRQQQCEQSANTTVAKAACATAKNTTNTAQLNQTSPSEEPTRLNETATAQLAPHNQAATPARTNTILIADASASQTYANTQLNLSPETIRTAEATDANPQGTSEGAKAANKALAKEKGINNKDNGNLPVDVKLEKIQIRAKRFHEIGPLPGLGLTKEEIPGNVQSITAKEIKESHSLSITDLMNSKLQSVSVNDYQSNPFQMDVNYRGFTASPQIGTAQGISVFLDGIRVNEPFGDVVNWDMLPMNALESLDVFPGSNPIFGLGTLGGALAMRTKSGFSGNTLDAEVLTGSFGRKQLQISAGGNNGVIAGFASGNFFLEDGWRDNSPSRVNQVFGKGEWRNEKLQLSLSGLYAGNKLTGNGLLPTQMVDQNPKQVYTSPDESKNDLLQFQLSGIWDVSDTFNVTGQIYKRKSKRKTSTSDVNENFGGSSGRTNNASAGVDPNQQYIAGFADINRDGKPDYNNYAYNVAADTAGNALTNSGTICAPVDFSDPCLQDLAIGTDFNTQANANQATVGAADGSGGTVLNWTYNPGTFLEDIAAQPASISGVFNAPVSTQYDQVVRYGQANYGVLLATLTGGAASILVNNTPHPGTGGVTYIYDLFNGLGQLGVPGFYTDDAGFYHLYQELNPINSANITNPLGQIGGLSSVPTLGPVVNGANGNTIPRDGKYGGDGSTFVNTGYIEGTPTALFTDTQIDQDGIGGALQLNWNLDKHKFMVGASVDQSDTIYDSKQYLGMLDANRRGFVAPELLGWEYFANSPANGAALNDFSGNSITKSLYFSETWKPTETLNINAAARFNHTVVENKLAVSALSSYADVNSVMNFLNLSNLCTDNNNDGTIDPNTECPTGLAGSIVPFNPNALPIDSDGQNIGTFRPPESDKFKYRSFNPSLGVTWQVNEDLNLYGSIGRGARTPSVIELGCAYDPLFAAQRRTCTLPGVLSGDPYLKQVRSTSVEMGARGKLTDDIEWNATVYQTDLSDDIYFVAVNAQSSFFQNVGDTRRRGIEMGLKGKTGKASFGVNYALTDATFQSAINLLSPNNSSAGNVYDSITGLDGNYQQIQVKPGNRMPGIPLHNLNFNFAYDVTNNWRVGLNAVMHSNAFLRGNENNKHKAGPATPLNLCLISLAANCAAIERADFGSGKTAGYTVFNFQTSYQFNPEWTLGLQVNNIFDKEYASAGRLGLNAFSPSINGAIGASGFNYNSADWQGTSFLGTGAPRAAFITLSYQFAPDKK